MADYIAPALSPRPIQGLGILGVGASKEEAIAAYDAAALVLQETLKKNLSEFPKAAAALNMWPKVVAEEKFFWDDRKETYEAWKGVTVWGSRVEKAEKYKARWLELAREVADKARAMREKPVTPGYDPYAGQKKDDDGSSTMLIIGAVLVLALVGGGYFYAKKKGMLSGVRRRRRSR